MDGIVESMSKLNISDPYEPTVKDLDLLHIESLNAVLHGTTRKDYIHYGPSKLPLWKKIATELITDKDVLNSMEKMDIRPCEYWLYDISSRSRNISICQLIEISGELRRNDVKYMLEDIYNLGIRYLYEMKEYHQKRLAEMLEDDHN